MDCVWTVLARIAGFDVREEAAVGKWTGSALLGWVWARWGPHIESYYADPFVLIVTVLWALDWILGFSLAVRERRVSTRRAFYSVVKWLVYMAALGVSWAFRVDGVPFDDWIAYLIGFAIAATEGISVLRNAARLTGLRRLEQIADYLDEEADYRFELMRHQQRRRREKAGLPPEHHEGPDEGPSAVPGGDAS